MHEAAAACHAHAGCACVHGGSRIDQTAKKRSTLSKMALRKHHHL
jgi:hypothetical protein